MRKLLVVSMTVVLAMTAAAAAIADEALPPVSFNVERPSLTPRFKGESVRALFPFFVLPVKGEFETTVEFKIRQEGAAANSGTYAFKIPISVTYNADSEIFKILPTTANISIGFAPTGREAYETDRIPGPSSEYEAKNAFGAKMIVHESSMDSYAVAERAASTRPPVLTLSVPRDRAPKVKPTLAMIVIAEISASDTPVPILKDKPEAGNGFLHAEATFASPYDVSASYHVLLGDFVGYWLFDDTTGRILCKATRTATVCPIQTWE